MIAFMLSSSQFPISSLHRCLQRHSISRLPDVDGKAKTKKKFKQYPIGYFHIDIAEVRTEEGKLYLFVAIDRTSKFTYVELHNSATKPIIVKQIEFAKKQLEQVRKDIEDIIDSDPDLKEKSKLLTSYKGVRRKIAIILLIEVPELGRLDNKEIACLVGVASKTNESGRKVGKAQIIGGRFYARKALYMSAVVAMRHNRRMKALYQRLVDSGKAAKVALVAVMRKIIICLNAMIKNNNFYLDV